MIVKRIIAHVINKVIIFIPALLLLGGISLMVAPNYFIFGKDDSGWLMVYLYKYLIFLPTVFLDLFRVPKGFFEITKIIVPTLICLIIIDIIMVYLLKRDIGMKIMGLKIVSTKNKPLGLMQIIVRTIIKYFSLAFFPFALVYIFFNKKQMTLHDKISCTTVVKMQK